MINFNKKISKYFYLIIPALLFVSCAVPPSYEDIHESSVQTPGEDEKVPVAITKGAETTASNSVEVPTDYELGLQESGPLFSTLNPNVNDQRKKAYIRKLMRVLKNKPQKNRIKVSKNERVQHYINRFTKRQRKTYSIWLDRSEEYIPTIQRILDKHGIPKDIAYLAMIESGFKMNARSHAAAVGPWQFIRSTGKKYRLRIDSWVDDRMDLEKSTHAAANYLNDLFDMFQSWELALAAYNCGEERTFKAVRKNKSFDFWTVARDLPRETRNYVPKYYAALTIAKNPRKYGFKKPRNKSNLDYEAVKVPPQRSLKEIAKTASINEKTLYKYNPHLVGKASPPGRTSYINVPKNYVNRIESAGDQIYALKKQSKPFYRSSYYYRVRRGDTLSTIARRHGTTVRNLKSHNNIKGSFIRAGQKLRIVKGSSSAPSYASSRSTASYSGSNKYKVRRGDSLSVIAERHGVSVRNLKAANNISGTKIKAGQTLRIPSKGTQTASKLNYKIKRGDTLIKIARAHSVSVSDIKKWNSLNSTKLIAGRNLIIYR